MTRSARTNTSLRARIARAPRLLGLALSLGGLSACGAPMVEAGYAYGSPDYYVDVVPTDIYGYPSVVYQGRPTYLVENRWYYQAPRGWVILRSEPPELARYRRAYPQRRSIYQPYQPYQPQPYYAPPYQGVPPPRVVPRQGGPYQPPVEQRRRYYPR